MNTIKYVILVCFAKVLDKNTSKSKLNEIIIHIPMSSHVIEAFQNHRLFQQRKR